MTFTLDTEVARVLQAAPEKNGPPPVPPISRPRQRTRPGRRRRPAGVRFPELDVTSGESVRRAAGCVERAEGHLDVLVNNASITGPA